MKFRFEKSINKKEIVAYANNKDELISLIENLCFEPLKSKDTRFLLQRITKDILSTSVTSGSSHPRYI